MITNNIIVMSMSNPSKILGLFVLFDIVIATSNENTAGGRNISHAAGERMVSRIFPMLPPINNQKKAKFLFFTFPTRLFGMICLPSQDIKDKCRSFGKIYCRIRIRQGRDLNPKFREETGLPVFASLISS
jgi:hypothetical protein